MTHAASYSELRGRRRVDHAPIYTLDGTLPSSELRQRPVDSPDRTEFLAVRINPELREVLERLAEQEERPAGMMARILRRKAIEAREKKGKVR